MNEIFYNKEQGRRLTIEELITIGPLIAGLNILDPLDKNQIKVFDINSRNEFIVPSGGNLQQPFTYNYNINLVHISYTEFLCGAGYHTYIKADIFETAYLIHYNENWGCLVFVLN